MNKPLPNDIKAENIVIASAFIKNDLIANFMEVIQPNDFYNSKNKFIYARLVEMFEKDIPIEIESFYNYAGEEKVKAIGGITFLAKLVSSISTTVNSVFYAEIVKKESNKRLLIKQCVNAYKEITENQKDATDVVANMEEEFLKFNSIDKEKTIDASRLMNLSLDSIEKKYKNKGEIPGIKTGYPSLDKATNGYQKGDLWIMAARPSIGKTLLSLNLLSNLSKGNNALMFELEMPKEKLGNRLLAAKSRVHSKVLARGKLTSEEFNSVTNSCCDISSKNNIYVNCKSSISVGYIRAEAKKIKIKCGLDVIFVDHLGLIKGNNPKNRNLELGEITRGLKAIAKDLDVCIVCLCQLSREPEQRQDKHPMLSDLRESGHIEEDADTVMLLYRDDYYAEREQRDSKKPNILETFIGKNRDGEVGGLEFYCDLETQFIGEKDFRG